MWRYGDCYIHKKKKISSSPALFQCHEHCQNRNGKRIFSLESKIMMWMCRYTVHERLYDTKACVCSSFRCDINWKRKKFSFSRSSLTQCLMASLESSYQHRIFFSSFLLTFFSCHPSNTHSRHISFLLYTLSQFFLIIFFLCAATEKFFHFYFEVLFVRQLGSTCLEFPLVNDIPLFDLLWTDNDGGLMWMMAIWIFDASWIKF